MFGLVSSSGKQHETMTQESAESDLAVLPLWAKFSNSLRGSYLSLIFNSLNLSTVISLASLLFLTFSPEVRSLSWCTWYFSVVPDVVVFTCLCYRFHE